MGWASAGQIFDRVASVLLTVGESAEATTTVLAELIAELQDGDWDTEDESLERFADEPSVVEAFARCGISVPGADAA